MGTGIGVARPQRAPVWLLGSGQGAQVWTVAVDARILVSVLLSDEPPMILLNIRCVDTPAEGAAIAWAFARIAEGKQGFHVWRN